MTVTKEEALRRLDELEKKVAEQKATFDRDVQNQKTAFEKVIDGLKGENQKLAHDLSIEKASVELYKGKLRQFDKLQEAIAEIKTPSGGMTPDQVRQLVKEEVARLGPVAGTSVEGVTVTENVPFIDMQVSKPWLTLDESTLEGRITILALGGKLPEKFVQPDMIKALELHYSWKVGGGNQTRRLKEALDELVGKYKTLERRQMPNGQWQYWLREDAKSRVKESETNDAVVSKD